MLYRLTRPLLFRLDAERAHDLAMRGMRFLAGRRRLARLVRGVIARPRSTPVRVMGLDVPHPIGLAAGFDKNGLAPLAWWAIGFGFVELGTVTPLPQSGNPRPRMFRFPAAGALVNRMGFNNDGAQAVAERLAKQSLCGCRPPFPIGVSIGKNAGTPLDRARDDYVAAATALAPMADFLAMNVSSPNTPGLRDLQERRMITGLIDAVIAAAASGRGGDGGPPVLVKVAPELDGETLDGVVDACIEAGAAGIIATNTLATGGMSDYPQGGLSGRPLRDLAPRRVEQIRRRAGDRLIIIGCGGIDDVESARRMLDAGANLIQLYTGLVFKGPFLAARLSRKLAHHARAS